MWALEAGYRRLVLKQGSPANLWVGNVIEHNTMLSVTKPHPNIGPTASTCHNAVHNPHLHSLADYKVLGLRRSDLFIHLNLDIDDEVSETAWCIFSDCGGLSGIDGGLQRGHR